MRLKLSGDFPIESSISADPMKVLEVIPSSKLLT